jgi:hypothetical protein
MSARSQDTPINPYVKTLSLHLPLPPISTGHSVSPRSLHVAPTVGGRGDLVFSLV